MTKSLLLLLALAGSVFAAQPKHRYLPDASALSAGETIQGPSRVLDVNGRKGINPTSIHTVIKLGAHNLNDAKGTVVLWCFALEDLGASFLADHMKMDRQNSAGDRRQLPHQHRRHPQLRPRRAALHGAYEDGVLKVFTENLPFSVVKP